MSSGTRSTGSLPVQVAASLAASLAASTAPHAMCLRSPQTTQSHLPLHPQLAADGTCTHRTPRVLGDAMAGPSPSPRAALLLLLLLVLGLVHAGSTARIARRVTYASRAVVGRVPPGALRLHHARCWGAACDAAQRVRSGTPARRATHAAPCHADTLCHARTHARTHALVHHVRTRTYPVCRAAVYAHQHKFREIRARPRNVGLASARATAVTTAARCQAFLTSSRTKYRSRAQHRSSRTKHHSPELLNLATKSSTLPLQVSSRALNPEPKKKSKNASKKFSKN